MERGVLTPRRRVAVSAGVPNGRAAPGVATGHPPVMRHGIGESLSRETLARLVPYHRAVFPRDTLWHLWSLMESQGAAPLLFHGQQGPESTRGDLVAFVRLLEPAQGETYLLLATRPDSAELEGFVWFDDIVRLGENTVRAAFNVCYRRRFWGQPAREASRMALRYGCEILGFSAIWGWTPWPVAARHAEAIGMTRMATLPGFAAGSRDLSLFRVLREEVLADAV